jgi:hypothetical protein
MLQNIVMAFATACEAFLNKPYIPTFSVIIVASLIYWKLPETKHLIWKAIGISVGINFVMGVLAFMVCVVAALMNSK